MTESNQIPDAAELLGALPAVREAADRRARAALELGLPLPDLSREDRTDCIDVMTDHERSAVLSWIAGYAPKIFDAAIAARSRDFADELADRADALRTERYKDELQPYCTACGASIGHFIGHGDGWHHFRGEGTTASPNELFDAGHDIVAGWR
jgi:hypothetical protein